MAGQLGLFEALEATRDHSQIAKLIDIPVRDWANSCHAISLAVLRSGVVGSGRVARGFAPKIASQHSWIVLGDDCYNPDAVIVDPTYRATTGQPDGEPLILVNYARRLHHRPHGQGDIFADYFKPSRGPGPIIELTPALPLSPPAREFLHILGPLDRQGWGELAHAPAGGWPAAEIIGAIADTPELAQIVPIDILGMVTDRNPHNLYR